MNIDIINLLIVAAAGIASSLFASVAVTVLSKLKGSVIKVKVGDKEIILSRNTNETLNEIYEKLAELQEHPRVFISYSGKDRDIALRLSKDLHSLGIDTWTADEQINIGDSITDKIKEGISTSQWFIFIVPENTTKSEFINRELETALQEEKKRDRTFILPLVYKSDKLPEQLKDRAFADFRENYEAGRTRLLSRLKYGIKPQNMR